MRILTRYVLSELLKVFLISLTGLTTLFVVVVVIREAQQEDLPLAQVLQLIPYALPEALRMTVPVTLLLACTSVFARMSGANEVVAAKALGISPMVLVWPALALAASLSLVTVWLNDLAVSWGAMACNRSSSDRSTRSSTACSARSTATTPRILPSTSRASRGGDCCGPSSPSSPAAPPAPGPSPRNGPNSRPTPPKTPSASRSIKERSMRAS